MHVLTTEYSHRNRTKTRSFWSLIEICWWWRPAPYLHASNKKKFIFLVFEQNISNVRNTWEEIMNEVKVTPTMVFSVIGDSDSFVPRPWPTTVFQTALIEAAKCGGGMYSENDIWTTIMYWIMKKEIIQLTTVKHFHSHRNLDFVQRERTMGIQSRSGCVPEVRKQRVRYQESQKAQRWHE